MPVAWTTVALELGGLREEQQVSQGMTPGLGWSGVWQWSQGPQKHMWPLYPFSDPGAMNSKPFPLLKIVGGERGSEERVKDIRDQPSGHWSPEE